LSQKNILLVEPGYKNKYPPVGLMKISTYHKSKGDNVHFCKGLSKEAVEKLWDRIYITSLFTFHYELTVSTIRYYKRAVNSINDIYVGGILASLLPEKLSQATGIKNIVTGQLEDSAKIGYGDHKNIDKLPLDYDILDDIDYQYPAGDNYFAYTTRGCPNRCSFCAVPKLEPEFKTTNHIYRQIQEIDKRFGTKRNLLLLDNNILNACDLTSIISDIKKAGFEKKPNFIEPTPFLTYCRRIEENINVDKNIQEALKYLNSFRNRIKKAEILAEYDQLLNEINSSHVLKRSLLARRTKLQAIIDRYKNKVLKQRYVDFNQGIDARLLTEERLKILCEIPISPLRIAFDSIAETKIYTKAVRLAHKFGFRELSNYMLYNHNDKPEDLWLRLSTNADLRDELGVNIFSFPMKYIPVFELDREYIGKHWYKKYIRAIQAILLVKKGIVSTNRSFFEKAFGSTLEEFFEILLLPEDFIIYRFHFEGNGLAQEWLSAYRSLSQNEKELLLATVESNKIILLKDQIYSKKLNNILSYYEIEYTE
jgi:hypothetical protein